MPRRFSSLLVPVFLMLLTVAPKNAFAKLRRSFGEQLHIRHGSYNHAVREDPLTYPLSNYYDQVDEIRPSVPPPPEQEDEDVYESSDLAEPSNSHLNGFNEELVKQELWGENDHKRVTPIRDTAKCFSCMSKFYEAVWPALASVYKRPMNFTDKCNEDILEARSVPVSHCSNICVGMWEEITVGVTWYRWLTRDSCREYRKRELFKLPVTQSDESSIHLCTCYADHCNHAASPSAAASNLQGATTAISLVCLAALLLLTLQHLLSPVTCPTMQDYYLESGACPRLHPTWSANLVRQYDNEAKAARAQPMDSWQKRKRRKAAI